MPDRTTLARLGKLVAADVTTGRPGANSWAASQVLEAHPEAVLDLIEMLVAEGRKTRPNEKLVSAYVYMIGQALEFIRIAAENGQASAQELADAVRLTLLQAGTSGLVEPILLVMILMEFSNAKLDPGADARGRIPGPEDVGGRPAGLAHALCAREAPCAREALRQVREKYRRSTPPYLRRSRKTDFGPGQRPECATISLHSVRRAVARIPLSRTVHECAGCRRQGRVSKRRRRRSKAPYCCGISRSTAFRRCSADCWRSSP